MRTNKQLRADAWAVFKRQWGPLFGVMILVALFSGVVNIIAETLSGQDAARLPIYKLILSVLAYPLCTMGLRYANLLAWSDGKLRVSAMFRGCAPVRRFACAMLPGLLVQGAALLIQIAMDSANGLFAGDDQAQITVLHVALVVSILGVSFWLFVRLLLLDYAFIAVETPNVFLLLHNAWKATAGHAGATIRMLLWLLLPFLLGLIPFWLVIYLDFTLLSLVAYAIWIPAMMYFRVVLAGFAMDRMPELARVVEAYHPAKKQALPEGMG